MHLTCSDISNNQFLSRFHRLFANKTSCGGPLQLPGTDIMCIYILYVLPFVSLHIVSHIIVVYHISHYIRMAWWLLNKGFFEVVWICVNDHHQIEIQLGRCKPTKITDFTLRCPWPCYPCLSPGRKVLPAVFLTQETRQRRQPIASLNGSQKMF